MLTKAEFEAIKERCEKATENEKEEVWKSINGLEGKYEVSNLGNVRSRLKKGNHRNKQGNPRLLKLRDNGGGYLSVSLPLKEDGTYKTVLVHKLVAEAFIGDAPEGKEIAHLDGDPSNNEVENLAYMTHEENESHKRIHGTVAAGERNGASKCKYWEVEVAKYLISKGIPQAKIADMFGWSRNTISEINLGKRWEEVKPYQDIPKLIAEIESLSPIGDLDAISSLRTENDYLKEVIEEKDEEIERLQKSVEMSKKIVRRLTHEKYVLSGENPRPVSDIKLNGGD